VRSFGFGLISVATVISSSVFADEEMTVMELSKVQAVMQKMHCRLKPEMIVKLDNGFVITDVYCADGTYTVRLDADFKIISKQAE